MFLTGVAVAALITIAGCSNEPPTGEISGKVLVDGKPATLGSITFIPTDGKTSTAGGEIKPDGTYGFKAPVGNMKVEIRVPKVVGKQKIYDTPDSPIQDVMEETLPDKYNNTTELTYEVKAGKQEKDWNVSTGVKKK
jgi:hypothetical protein